MTVERPKTKKKKPKTKNPFFKSIPLLPCVLFFLSLLFIGVRLGAEIVVSPARFDVQVTPQAQDLQRYTFTLRVPDEPETLDWNRAHTPVEAKILMNLMEGLVTFDTNLGGVAPCLAESWTISPDGKVYTFKIRSDVKWSDGVLLKAQDFVDSWKRLLAPITAAPYAYILYDIVGAEDFSKGVHNDFEKVGITAPTPNTLQVTLKNPVTHWIQIPAFWVTFPIRKDIIDKFGEGWAGPGRMVNLGPFSLTALEHSIKIVMQANPTYYGNRGNLKQVIAMIVKDDHEAFLKYEAGKMDFMNYFTSTDLDLIKGRPDFKIFKRVKVGFLGFQTNKFPASNIHLRRAIAMAIDKTKLKEVFRAGAQTATSLVPPPLPGYSDQIGLPFDLDQAKQEYKLSGLNTGLPLRVEYLLPDWEQDQKVGQLLHDQLMKNLGIDLVLQPRENKSFRTQLGLAAYPSFDFTWTADYPDPDNFISLFLKASGTLQNGWGNDNFDAAIREARATQNAERRKALYLDMQRTLIEKEVVIVPLYYEPNLVLVKPRVMNFELNLMGYLFLRKIYVSP